MSVEQDVAALQVSVQQLQTQQILPAEILDRVSALVGRRDVSQLEFADWLGGSANGGPKGDGTYPLTDGSGFTRFVSSPSAISALAMLAASLGGSDIAPQQAVDRAAELNALFAGSKANLKFEPGDYHVSKGGGTSCCQIVDRKNLTVRAGGARLVQDFNVATAETDIGQTLQIEGCVGLSISDLRLGYTRPPAWSGTITAIATDRSTATFVATDEPPTALNFDRYVLQDERDGRTKVTEYAARDDDYDPTINYSVTPVGGQNLGEPGLYQIAIPLVSSALATVVPNTDALTFVTATAHGLPNGCKVTIAAAGGLEIDGVSIVNGLTLTARTISPTSFQLEYSADEPVTAVGATPYVPGTGTVTMQRVSPEANIGDKVTLWYRKHLQGPVQIYASKDVTFGTVGAPIIIDDSAASIIRGRDIENLEFNIRSRRSAAGGIVLRDVRGIVRGSMVAEFNGDDVINIAVGMWMNRVVGPFKPGSTTAIAANANFLDVQFATSRTQLQGLTLPKLRDLIAFSDPIYNNLIATLMVKDLQALGPKGLYRVTFDGTLPANLDISWYVLNASCRPKYRLQELICRGGGRLFLDKTDDCEVDLIAGYGMNNSLVLSRDPSSPQHPTSGGAAGGFKCRKLIAEGCQYSFGNRNSAVISLRRAGGDNRSSDRPSDYWYNFDDAEIDRCGYGGVSVDGMNVRVGRITTARMGELRASTPELHRGTFIYNAAFDYYANQGICEIGSRNPYEAFSFYEGDNGFVFFPNGSLLVRESTIAAGDLEFEAAKKLQVGHERRARVWIDGREQDPASYVANDTTLPVFKTAPLTTPGATAKCVVEHVRC